MHTLLIRYVVRYGTVRKAENWLYCSKGSFFHNTIVVTNTSPMQNWDAFPTENAQNHGVKKNKDAVLTGNRTLDILFPCKKANYGRPY